MRGVTIAGLWVAAALMVAGREARRLVPGRRHGDGLQARQLRVRARPARHLLPGAWLHRREQPPARHVPAVHGVEGLGATARSQVALVTSNGHTAGIVGRECRGSLAGV